MIDPSGARRTLRRLQIEGLPPWIQGSDNRSARLTPDGKWMAYASNETGRDEVWMEPLPQTGTRYQLTRDGGSHPMCRMVRRSISTATIRCSA